MYQTIDDADETAEGGERNHAPWIWVAIGFAALALVLVVLLLMPSEPRRTVSTETLDEARTAYLSAIAEPSPALRRARLADFGQTYPDDPRASAVTAHLSVLDAREGSDWAIVTDVLYDRDAPRLDKIAAIDAYEAKWGANLLGGRADEIARLRTELEAEPDPTPTSRALEEDTSPIPSSIQGSSMAGGVERDLEQPVIILPPDTDRVVLPPEDVVETPPELRRAPTPTYPRSARRRDIGGIVELEMDIDDRGRVDEVRILRVVADRYGKDFARAAERAAERSRFRPRRLNGEAVPTIGYKKRYIFEP